MKINVSFDDRYFLDCALKSSNPLLSVFIHFEHKGTYYPSDDWLDNTCIINWWLKTVNNLMWGFKYEELTFMEGSYEIAIFKDLYSNEPLTLTPKHTDLKWQVKLEELVNEVLKAAKIIEQKLKELNIYQQYQKHNPLSNWIITVENSLKKYKIQQLQREEEYQEFLDDLYSSDLSMRVATLEVAAEHPLLDYRVIPHLKRLLTDNTPCIYSRPYTYSQLKLKAAEALAMTLYRMSENSEIVIKDAVIPLKTKELNDLAAKANITLKGGEEGVLETFDTLHWLNKLPVHTLKVYVPRNRKSISTYIKIIS